MSYNLEFDSQTHTYRVDGRVVPSVTQILKNTGFIDDRFFTVEAAQRGTRIHEASVMVENNTLDWFSINDEDHPYVRAYEKFLKESEFKAIMIEYRLYCKVYNFTGTPDRVGYLGDKPVIIDLKTGAKQNWWILQLAGYKHLVKMNHPMFAAAECLSLELRDNGNYNLCPHVMREETQIFLAAAAIENYKHKRK